MITSDPINTTMIELFLYYFLPFNTACGYKRLAYIPHWLACFDAFLPSIRHCMHVEHIILTSAGALGRSSGELDPVTFEVDI